MIKVGIIGFGKMGKIRADAVEKCGGKIVSVYDIKTISSKYKQVDSLYDILKNKKIDTVFIATPNCYNKKLTIESLIARKNVFCEKPPIMPSEDMNEIIKVEQKSNKKLMYGFNHRHHTSIQKMKQIIDQNELGKILWMRGRYGKHIAKKFFNTWRAKKEMAGGGILLDQGIHMLDLFLYMAKGFDKVKSFLSNSFWKLNGIEDNVFMIFKNTKTDITASMHSTMTQWRHIFSFEIFLEKGYMVLDGLKTSSNTYGDEILIVADNNSVANNLPQESYRYHINNSWKNEVKYFFDCIKNNEKINIGNSNDAFKIMQLIKQIYNQNIESVCDYIIKDEKHKIGEHGKIL